MEQKGPVQRMVEDVDKHNSRLEADRKKSALDEAGYIAKQYHSNIFRGKQSIISGFGESKINDNDWCPDCDLLKYWCTCNKK